MSIGRFVSNLRPHLVSPKLASSSTLPVPAVFVQTVQCLGHSRAKRVRAANVCLSSWVSLLYIQQNQDSVHRHMPSFWVTSETPGVMDIPGRHHHTTEDELGMPWMVALVGVPLMALKIWSESGRTLFMPSSTGLIWKKEKPPRSYKTEFFSFFGFKLKPKNSLTSLRSLNFQFTAND